MISFALCDKEFWPRFHIQLLGENKAVIVCNEIFSNAVIDAVIVLFRRLFLR